MVTVCDFARTRVICLHRPTQRNAVDGPTARALWGAVKEADEAEEVDVIVVWGGGGRFCAGADLKAFSNPLNVSM